MVSLRLLKPDNKEKFDRRGFRRRRLQKGYRNLNGLSNAMRFEKKDDFKTER